MISFHLEQFLKWLGHIEDIFSGIWGVSVLSSIMVTPVYTPTNSGIEYFSPRVAIIYWVSSDASNSKWGKLKLQCGFNLHCKPEHFLHVCYCWNSILWEMPFHVLCLFLYWNVLLLSVWALHESCIFTLCQSHSLQIFSLILLAVSLLS